MALQPTHNLKTLLQVAELPRSTFYYHASKQHQADSLASLNTKIKAIYHQHKGRYGYRRITAELRNLGECINHKKVQRLMQRVGLKSVVRVKKYHSYRGHEGRIAPNVLQRDFESEQPNKKWVTDITEFNVAGEKLYLSPVMDLFNREVIAYEMQSRPVLSLVIAMMNRAKTKLKPNEKPVVHSDQGWHYQHRSYQALLKDNNLVQSMSRKGNCLDNAAMESFFGLLKSELFYLQKWESVDALKKAIGEYISYYNYERIKLKLKGLSPINYRTQFLVA